MILSMHYNIDVDTDRKIAVAKIYGIWKAALALEYHNEYKKLVDPLLGRGWAKLTNLTNWKSSYPEIVTSKPEKPGKSWIYSLRLGFFRRGNPGKGGGKPPGSGPDGYRSQG